MIKGSALMTYIRAIVSFLMVFILGFILGGWFLMPYLPPIPNGPVSVYQLEYWNDNWAGGIIGGILGLASAYLIIRRSGSN